ncbi:uncharacterized protein LOC142900359 [Nelusetta ayraudi]|uniref:uncharacterized protein LOC142900359 n=1 Tax=Nelusetta ayraudi TaxID=303726 RepID=UPI003F7244B0
MLVQQSIDSEGKRDDDSATGTSYSDQRSENDDEYCPCETCIKKRIESGQTLPAEILNTAPVLVDFDLKNILMAKNAGTDAERSTAKTLVEDAIDGAIKEVEADEDHSDEESEATLAAIEAEENNVGQEEEFEEVDATVEEIAEEIKEEEEAAAEMMTEAANEQEEEAPEAPAVEQENIEEDFPSAEKSDNEEAVELEAVEREEISAEAPEESDPAVEANLGVDDEEAEDVSSETEALDENVAESAVSCEDASEEETKDVDEAEENSASIVGSSVDEDQLHDEEVCVDEREEAESTASATISALKKTNKKPIQINFRQIQKRDCMCDSMQKWFPHRQEVKEGASCDVEGD